MLKVYIGCGLSRAPKEFVDKVLSARSALEGGGYKVLRFVTNPDATVADIYRNDIFDGVSVCDFMIAFDDHASTGLGFELGMALGRYGKPVLIISDITVPNSKLIRGIPTEFGPDRFHLSPWAEPEELVRVVVPKFLRQVGLLPS